MDRDTAHAVMTTSMLLVGATVILSQGWWQGLRNFIAQQTQSGAKNTLPAGTKPLDWRWVWGFVMLWILFSLMVESQTFSELGAALAGLTAMSVLFKYGPQALQNIGVINAQGK